MIALKKFFIAFCFVIGLYCLQSCGNHVENDPQAVAEAAMKSFVNSDFRAMKSLLRPTDKEGQALINQREALIQTNNADSKLEYAFERLEDDSEGKVAVFSASDGNTYRVRVIESDGQWFFERYENF